MTDQEPAEQASLLGMPPEIRNRIYREVLVDYDDYISLYDERLEFPDFVRKGNTRQPGLLRSCKQVRQEALPIFLQENRFSTWIREGKLEPHLEHWFWKTKVRSIAVTHDIKWNNVKIWLKAYWDGRLGDDVYREVFSYYDEPIYKVCLNAYEIARLLKGIRWQVVDAVLDEFAETVKMVGAGPFLLMA